MKILILQGSAHLNGNTAAMVKAFSEGGRTAGHEVEIVNTAYLNIGGCRDCGLCQKEGNRGLCSQKDDMPALLEKLDNAEMLVVASPIYYHTVTSSVQAVMERTYAIGIPSKLRKFLLIMSSGSSGVYSPALAQFEKITRYFGCENMGMLTAYGSQNKDPKHMDKIMDYASRL